MWDLNRKEQEKPLSESVEKVESGKIEFFSLPF